MAPVKRGLLIGSSYGDLPGTQNDVKTMVDVLTKHGFRQENMKTLCDGDATRQNILDAWQHLISDTSNGDCVVIYYSGHGGLAERKEPGLDAREPHRIQFLVPSDYDASLKNWRGILDSEVSKLLLDTTTKTQNVTYILDCCHAARLGRGRPPKGFQALPKSLSTSEHSAILEHVKQLREAKKLLEDDCWANPDVVRIAAAADVESAWQYRNTNDQFVGILTEKLAQVTGSTGARSSWRNIMLEVGALVEGVFTGDQAPQRPRSAGADTRIPFSTDRDWSRMLVAEIQPKRTIIQGGRVHGVEKGDSYTLTPFLSNSQIANAAAGVTTVAVEKVNGFTSKAASVTMENFPDGRALARPDRRQRRWPIAFPSDLQHAQTLLDASSIFRSCEPNEEPLLEFRLESERSNLALYGRGVQIGSTGSTADADIQDLFSIARMFAQSQDLLSLEKGSDDEEFSPDVEIELGVVRDGEEESQAHYKTK